MAETRASVLGALVLAACAGSDGPLTAHTGHDADPGARQAVTAPSAAPEPPATGEPAVSADALPAVDGPPTAVVIDPQADWLARSTHPDVVLAVGFDTRQEWLDAIHERSHCHRRYAPGCRTNAWDPQVSASGGGSVRFDILSNSGESDFGSVVVNFSDIEQFGAGEDLWIQWRQRFDAYVIEHEYRFARSGMGWKQVILAQGDRRGVEGFACSENQIVIANLGSRGYAGAHIECLAYDGLYEFLGRIGGSGHYTAQSERGRRCIHWPPQGDRSGCFGFHPDEWMTFMLHLDIGREGRAATSVGRGGVKRGFVDSTYELYIGREGRRLELVHRQEGLVLPRGQHWDPQTGRDPDVRGDPGYRGSWRPNNAHPEAEYGRFWLTPFMTAKDRREAHADASIWYDEIIVSRSRIVDPGFAAPR